MRSTHGAAMHSAKEKQVPSRKGGGADAAASCQLERIATLLAVASAA